MGAAGSKHPLLLCRTVQAALLEYLQRSLSLSVFSNGYWYIWTAVPTGKTCMDVTSSVLEGDYGLKIFNMQCFFYSFLNYLLNICWISVLYQNSDMFNCAFSLSVAALLHQILSSMFSLPSCGKFIRSHRNWVKNWTLRNKIYILTAHLREYALETEVLVVLLIFKAQMAFWKHLWIAHPKYSTFIHNWSTPGYNSQMK